MSEKEHFLHDLDEMLRVYQHDVLASTGKVSDHLANAAGYVRKKRTEYASLPDEGDFAQLLAGVTATAKRYADGAEPD
jgi:hypothetical protein